MATRLHPTRKPFKVIIKSLERAQLQARDGVVPTAEVDHALRIARDELARVRVAG